MTILEITIALYVLHRFGPIAAGVVQRHLANPTIASFQGTLLPAVEAFTRSYEALGMQKLRTASALLRRDELTSALYRATSGWLGPVCRDLPGFDGRDYGINPNVDQDVVTDSQRLVGVVRTAGASLPYAEALVADLTARIAVAIEAIAAAEQARADQQRLQGETRAHGAALQRELVALRRTLRAELGTRHLDYQRLRVPRTRIAPELEVAEATAAAPSASAETAPANGHSST